MSALRRFIVLLSASFAFAMPARAAVWIAVSEGSSDYAAVAEAIRAGLQREDATLDASVRSWRECVQGVPGEVRLIVSVGSQALKELADASGNGRLGKTPLIATLLPRSVYEELRPRLSGPLAGIVLDQPPARQMALLRYAFPHLRRVGVLLGPESQQFQSALDKAAQEFGLQLNSYKVDGEANLYPALQRVLEENDVLLAIPDSAVYNGGSIQNVLLASYRQRVPLMGFSPAYVRAGAMLALYSTPAQIAAQTARVARALLSGATVPAMQAPQEFAVGVNANVARSLGFRLSEDALRIHLQNREGL